MMHVLLLLMTTALGLAAPRELVILHVNDIHGHGMPREYLGTDLPPEYLHRDIGGLFSVATRVRQVREGLFADDPALAAELQKSGDDGILMLEAGDLWSGTLDDGASRGQNMVDVLLSPALDVDASCPGNHAWDFGQKRWEELSRKMSAHHPVLCANMTRGGKPLPFLKPWSVVKVRGIRVGVIGILTPTAVAESLPENAKGLDVRDPIDAIANALAEMRKLPEKERPQITVALAHVGFDRALVHNGTRGSGFSALADMDDGPGGVDSDTARNVDVVIDGHSHMDLERQIDANTVLVQADHYALKMGEIRIPWDAENERISGPVTMKKFSLFADELPPDPAMLKEQQGRVASARAQNEAVLVQAEGDLAVPCVPRTEQHRLASPSGDLLMRALLEMSAGKDGVRPDVALINQSGVREGLYASRSGVITAGAVHAVCPFANPVESCDIRARDLVVLLGHAGIQQYARMSWAGLEVTVLQEGKTDASALTRKLTAVWLVQADGARVNLMEPEHQKRILKVVAPSFLMSRELAPYMVPGSRRKTGAADKELLASYLKVLAKDSGKITKAGIAQVVGEPTRLVIEN